MKWEAFPVDDEGVGDEQDSGEDPFPVGNDEDNEAG